MKINSVEAYLLSCPSPDAVIPQRDAMLVRVTSGEGMCGYAPAPATVAAKQIIDHLVAPFLNGRDLSDPDALRVLFQQGPGNDAEASNVYSAVEIALYDLAGKARNVPVSELIGGRVRDRIRIYSSGAGGAAEAIRARQSGFGGYKMRLRRANAAAAIRSVREEVGAGFELMATAFACGYSEEEAADLLREISGERLRWLEDPLPPAEHEAWVRLRQTGAAPIAGGSHEPSELRLLDLIESAAVDYVEMDLVRQGGFATARRLFPDIARAGLRFAFSNMRGSALDLIAAAHLGACWPESVVRWLEYPLESFLFPPSSEIFKHPLSVEGGCLVVPRGAGLGVEVDESVIWRYPWKPQ